MYHKQNLLFAKKYQKILVLCTVFFLMFTSIGLASFSSEFILDNEAIIRAGKDIRITSVSFASSSNGGYANYGDYPKVNNNLQNGTEIYKNFNSSSINLSNGFTGNTSTITYNFTVKNNTSTNYYFDTISIHPGRIDVNYSISIDTPSGTKTLETGDIVGPGSSVTGSITCSTTYTGNVTELGDVYFSFNYLKPLSVQMILDNNPGHSLSYNLNQIELRGNPSNYATTSSTNEGMYMTYDDYGKSYYYRGLANNYVEFNGMMWRIIRRNGDNSVRLAYHGMLTDYPSSNGIYTSEPTASSRPAATEKVVISTKAAYNTTGTYNKVGYMYSSTNTNYTDNDIDSKIKTVIDNWYAANILNKVDSNNVAVTNYLSDAIFCNDRSRTSTANSNFNFNSMTRYPGTSSSTGAINPSLLCSSANDRFTVNTSNGNGKLTYPIATFTMDEAVFSGIGRSGFVNEKEPFLGPKGGAGGNSVNNIFSMTPRNVNSSNTAYVFGTNNASGIVTTGGTVSKSHWIKPVINIRSDIYVESGNGTLATPYKLLLQVTNPTITQAVTKIKYQHNNVVENLVALNGGNTFDLVVKEGNTVITNTGSLSIGVHTLTFTAINEYNASTTRNFNFEVLQLNNSCYVTGPSDFQRNPTFSIHVENPSQLTANPYKFNSDAWTSTNSYTYSGGPFNASIKDTNFGEIHCGGTIETQRRYQRYSCTYTRTGFTYGPLHIIQPGEFEGCVSLSLTRASCTKIYRSWCGGYDGEPPIVWKDPVTGEIEEYGRPEEVAMCGYGDYPDRVIGRSDFMSFNGTCTPIGDPSSTSCGANSISQNAYDDYLTGTRCEEDIKYKINNTSVSPTITQIVNKIHYGSNLNTNRLVNVTGGNYISLIVKEGNSVIQNVSGLSFGNHTLTFIATNEYNRITTQNYTFSVETLTSSCTVTGPSDYEPNPTFTITVSSPESLAEIPYRFNGGNWQTDNTFTYTGGSFSASINDLFLGNIDCSGTVTSQKMYRRGTCIFTASGSGYSEKSTYYEFEWFSEYKFYRNEKRKTCVYNSSGNLISSEGTGCASTGRPGTLYGMLSTTMNRTSCSSWTDWQAGNSPGWVVSYCVDATHCTAYVDQKTTYYNIN